MSRPASSQWTEGRFDIGEMSFPYYFGSHCLDRVVAELAQYDADLLVVVTDDTVARLHGDVVFPALAAAAPLHVFSRPPGEGMKTIGTVQDCLDAAVAAGSTRRSVVVSFGGGVPGNVAGTVAGLLYRGVRLVHLPTTTVAATDSVLSLKQAVNGQSGKNHFGLYRRPEAVYVDVALLRTLPDRELRSGLCEFAKNALAIHPALLAPLRERLRAGMPREPEMLLWMIEASLAAKHAVMRQDAYEQSTGLVLEYGHTVGHAVELCAARRRGVPSIAHGEAIALGALVAARVSAVLGHLDKEAVGVHEELLGLLGVRERVSADLPRAEILAALRKDSKRGYLDLGADEAAFVLLRALGQPLGDRDRPLMPVPLGLVAEVLDELGIGKRGALGLSGADGDEPGHPEVEEFN
ncbi:2-deoxy-scyllo-inosose synthase [Streptomyces erythrochromogenes]|uniref:2-deoxy-scyllo-inosose synthase n=1 Tax=Streptomyces erythrochromogenes TaxID=285574 RepID=UPI00363BFC14